MRSSFQKRITSFALIFTLFCGTAIPIFADNGGAAAKPAVAPKATEVIAGIVPVGSVAINKKSNFELKQVAILAGDEDKTVTFTVTVINGEDTELQFIDYWVRLTNQTGAKYTINLMPEDKDKNRVAPHSSLDFHFYAKVNSKTGLKDLKFSFIQWDFTLGNYERSLGTLSIPATYTDLTPVQVKRIIPVLGTSLKTAISRVAINKTDENYLVSVYYSIENIGLKSVKLPAYSFDLLTAEGYVYPLDAKSIVDLTLAPRVKKEVVLTTTVPTGVAAKGWKMQVTKPDETVKVLPVALYALPQSDTAAGADSTRVIDVSGTAVNTTINRASLTKTETNYMSNIFFTFANNGSKTVLLPEYTFNVKTKDGLIYPLTATAFTKISLNPKESKEFQLSVSIPLTVNVDELELQLVQPQATGTTGTDNGFNYPIATYKVPKSTPEEASTEFAQVIDVAGKSINAIINRASMAKTETSYTSNIFMSFENNGAKAVLLPEYLFNVKTKDGLVYPLTATTFTKISLNPKESKEFQLSVSIPLTVDVTELELQLVQPSATGTDSSFNYPIATFKVPESTTQEVSFGYEYFYTNTNGSYSAQLVSVQRLPWEDQDILSAEISISNKGTAVAPPTKLQGYFLLDGKIKIDASILDMDKAISIPSSGKASYVVMSKIPYTSQFSDLKLVLQEKKSETDSLTIAEFKSNADMVDLPTIAKGESYKLLNTGKSAELTVTNLYTYKGTTNDLYYLELDMKSLEKRITTSTPLSAYLKTKDDLYFPAKVIDATGKINPGGKAVVAITAELPQGLKGTDIELLIGQAVNSVSSGPDPTVSTDGYIRVAKMVLPDENTTVSGSLSGMVIQPYTIGLSNFKSETPSNVNNAGFNINFDYSLAKSTLPLPTSTNLHKLVVEITDSASKKHKKEFDFKDLTVGAGSTFIPITFATDNEFIEFIKNNGSSNSYTINVYDQITTGTEVYTKLLGSTNNTWTY
ncbi:hypothetical protein EHS13_33560 [Paenibacillus psychroresistens]|uniref:Uncharacterized protein n=1 Tax=Paenibacillus psychroresistens TaxID=1778678 RepID=A0A6B8RSN0_9BACL|nr:hypothetical protein [Paenibacillus psychroresistens]QGQ99440.1 hypothetical protein EHS13_33560 [Paenibacillus psychroresistens]